MVGKMKNKIPHFSILFEKMPSLSYFLDAYGFKTKRLIDQAL